MRAWTQFVSGSSYLCLKYGNVRVNSKCAWKFFWNLVLSWNKVWDYFWHYFLLFSMPKSTLTKSWFFTKYLCPWGWPVKKFKFLDSVNTKRKVRSWTKNTFYDIVNKTRIVNFIFRNLFVVSIINSNLVTWTANWAWKRRKGLKSDVECEF
jgi:hypothetical protein